MTIGVSELLTRLEAEIRRAAEEAAAVEDAVAAAGLTPSQGVQRLDHLRQHLMELGGVLERLRGAAACLDIVFATQDVSLSEVKARLRGASGPQPRSGELDLF